MNKTTVDKAETEDQIIETSESLRDYLRACTRQALRSVIDEEVARATSPMIARRVGAQGAHPLM